jgi:hypothetical protein
MEAYERTSRLLVFTVILIGLATSVRGQDSSTPIDVNVPCDDFEAYVLKDQGELQEKVNAGPQDVNDWGLTKINLGNKPLLDYAKWDYDIPANQAKKLFHCMCTGQYVEDYETDCPIGIKCFWDSRCPYGKDCSNKICGHAYMTKFDPPISVKSAYFQWSPQPVPAQCKYTMTSWNYDNKTHEELHNSDDRAAINLFIQNVLKLTSEECAQTEGELKAKLNTNMRTLIDEAESNLSREKNLLATIVHDLRGAGAPAPDCSCMSMSK